MQQSIRRAIGCALAAATGWASSPTASAQPPPAPSTKPAAPTATGDAAPSEPAEQTLPCPPGAYCERAPWTPAPPAADPSSDPGTAVDWVRDGDGDGARASGRYRPRPDTGRNDPEVLPYEPGDPIPPGYRRVKLTHDGLLAAGGIVVGVSYLPWLAIGLLSLETDDPSLAYVAIPLVGPPLLSLQYDLHETWVTALIVNSGVQGLGVALLVASQLAGDNILVRDGSLRPRWHVAPWIAPASLGLTVRSAL